MAQVLAEGTGAEWTQVWLLVDDQPSWPRRGRPALPDVTTQSAGSQDAPGRPCARRHAGRTRGSACCGSRSLTDAPLTPVEERLFEGLAAQAGPVVHGAQLRAELSNRVGELEPPAEELRHRAQRARRQRTTTSGAASSATSMTGRSSIWSRSWSICGWPRRSRSSPDRARGVLADAGAPPSMTRSRPWSTCPAVSTRRSWPKRAGGPARSAALDTSAVPVEVRDRGSGRHSAELEAAVYFCCMEAVQNAAKHAAASRIEIELDSVDDRVTLLVRDDGCGFEPRGRAGGRPGEHAGPNRLGRGRPHGPRQRPPGH